MELCRIPGRPRPHDKTLEAGYELLVQEEEGEGKTLFLLVNGAYCAACIHKIESCLACEKDVQHARFNFSTGRLVIKWNGEATRANSFVATIKSLGYEVHPYSTLAEKNETAREERFLLLCLGVAGFAAGNIMLLSVGLWTTDAQTMGFATRDFLHWISAAIALPALLFSGRPFFRSAFSVLRTGNTNMDVPISVALVLTAGMSLFETMHHGEDAYFDSVVMLVFFLLIGRYLDFRAKKNARTAATDLLSTMDGFATLIQETEGHRTIRHVPVRTLEEGQIIHIAVGERFPIDGVVLEGRSELDKSLVTGETLPEPVDTGDSVCSGTINLSAPLVVRVKSRAAESFMAEIVRLMERAGESQSTYVRLADRVARLYTPVVHILALLTFLGWWGIGDVAWQDSLLIAVTVLIITCPCALGLAVPIVHVLASSLLLRRGILLKSGDALERLARVDTVLLDKTGTLTYGNLSLVHFKGQDDLMIAASLAAHSRHPLCTALHEACGNTLLPSSEVVEHAGLGLEGFVRGERIRLGSAAWCGVKTEDTDQEGTPFKDSPQIWLQREKGKPTPFVFRDTLREDSRKTVLALQEMGLDVAMLSGDRLSVAKTVAQDAGISSVFAPLSPTEKFAHLEALREKGRHVLMVGDGLNDAPTLAGADVSMAPGSALDITQNAADIIFMGRRLKPVFETYTLCVFSQKLVRVNFFLAVFYNIIVIPFAMAGFITPLAAAAAMSTSSLLVTANSFRLRFFE